MTEAAALYRWVFDSTSEPALLVDAGAATVLEANGPAGRAFGREPAALRGRSLAALVGADASALASAGRVDTPYGELRAMALSDGPLLCLLRPSTFAELGTFDAFQNGWCVIERVPGDVIDFRYLEQNAAFSLQTGLPDLVGRTIREAISDIGTVPFETYDDVLRTGEPRRFERFLPNGTVLELYAFRVDATRVAVVCKDITELARRHRDDQLLSELDRQLVGTFDFAQMAALLVGAARKLTGADGATFVVREGERVRYVAEDSREPLWTGLDFPVGQCISGWAMIHDEPALIPDIYEDARVPIDAYRGTFVKSLVMTPVGPGLPIASIGVYWAKRYDATPYDIELLRSLASAADLALASARSYDEAKRARAEAEAANQLKDEFVATLSHELRNPLNVITGYTELLLSDAHAHSAPTQRALESIAQHAAVQAQLVDDLLDLSRLQTGKLSVVRKPIALGVAVRDAVATVRSRAADKDIALRVELDESLRTSADRVRVQQVAWNLVSNAVKFTPPGGRVSVSLARRGDVAELVVEDTGQGIDAAFLPHVFEPFRQADSRTTRVHGGLGIGLSVVRQLVELHDGTVEAHSDGDGRGARFAVRLPLAAVEPAVEPKAPAPARARKLDGTRILVVDDTEDSVEMLGLLLVSEGATVETALTGEEALRAAQKAQFDLVISDISMPGMDGYQFMAQLRALERYHDTPSIALTGFGRDEDVNRAKQAGFTGHLTKPINFATLVTLAKSTLSS